VAEFDPLLAFLIATVLGVAGFVAAQLWAVRNRKDRQAEDIKNLAYDVEKIAREKSTTERNIAKELAETAAKLADEVRDSMKEYVGQLLATLKQDIKLEHQRVYSNMESRESRIDQLRKDFEELKHFQYKFNDAIQKSLERIQTMQWGPSAKSVLPTMLDEIETEEHKSKPDKGVFKQQTDSERDKQTEDNEERLKRAEEDDRPTSD